MRVYAWRSPPSLIPQERGDREWKYRDRGVCGHAALNEIHGQYKLRRVQRATILRIDKVPACLRENLCRRQTNGRHTISYSSAPEAALSVRTCFWLDLLFSRYLAEQFNDCVWRKDLPLRRPPLGLVLLKRPRNFARSVGTNAGKENG
jgi:hypothetical protein